MKKLCLLLTFSLYYLPSWCQVSFIGRLGDNIGGSTRLFGNSISTTSDAFIDIEVFASGNCTTTGAGQATKVRAVLRKTEYGADPNTVIASSPTYVDAT
jgi:hypothetical protein